MIEFEAEEDIPTSDLENERATAIEDGRKQSALQRMLERGESVAEAEAPALTTSADGASDPAAAISEPPPIDPEEESKSLFRSIGSGLINAPGNVIGGALDAGDEFFETIRDISGSGNRFMMETLGIPAIIRTGPGQYEFTTDADRLEATPDIGDMLPDVGDEEDKDSIVRGLTKFFIGFAIGGKALKGMKIATGLAKSGFAGQSALASIKGAVADFAFMDEMENPANILVDTFPSLGAVVPEFMRAMPGDTDVEMRMKNALVGVGLGTLTDTVFGGLRLARAAIRSRSATHTAVGSADEALRVVSGQNKIARDEFNALLGDVDGPLFEIKPSTAARSGTKQAAGIAREGDDVFINFARMDTQDDVKEMIRALAENDSAGISIAQRGVRSHIDTELAADSLNAWDVLTSRRQGAALNAEEAVAARKLWAASGAKTLQLSEQAAMKGASDVTQVAFRKQLALHSTIQREVLGARTETARALNSWKIPAGDDFAFFSQMEALTAEMERGVPTKRLAENIQTLHAMGRIDAADTFMYGAGRISKLMRGGEKASNMFRQFWYFSLLSRATTHIRNTVGNTARQGMELMDRRVAEVIGEVTGSRNVPTGEAAALLHGQAQGFKEAFKISSEARRAMKTAAKMLGSGNVDDAAKALADNGDEFGTFWRSVATGDSGFGIGKVDARASGAFSPETLGLDPASNFGRFMNSIDIATSTPGRALAAGDEIFKSISFNAERHAQAFRKATQELDSGAIASAEDFARRVAEIANDPDETIKLLMREAAQHNTFTNDPGNGKIWSAVKEVSKVPVIGRLMLPFQRTPYNIANEVLRRSPMGALMPSVWRDIAAGGAKGDLAWSRLLTGNAILLGMADLALSGKITGERPRLSNESGRRGLERRLDVNSMTWRLELDDGNTLQVPYRGFEPLSFPMGLASNLVEILDSEDFRNPNKETENLIIASSAAIGAQLSSANYMRGMTEFFSFQADPTRYGGRYFENIARSMAPGAISQFVSGGIPGVVEGDPYIRSVDGMFEAFLSQIPGASKSLPLRRDLWGNAIKRNAPGVLGSIMPYQTSGADQEPIDLELQRLGSFPTDPSKTAHFPVSMEGNGGKRFIPKNAGSVPINLNRFPEVYSRYVELQGNALKDPVPLAGRPPVAYVPTGKGLLGELNAIVSGNHPSSGYYKNQLADGENGGRAEFIQSIMNYYRKAARIQIIDEFPEIAAEVDIRKDEADHKFQWQQQLAR